MRTLVQAAAAYRRRPRPRGSSFAELKPFFLRAFCWQVETMSYVRHPNLVPFLGASLQLPTEPGQVPAASPASVVGHLPSCLVMGF
jgi:hypothetical protein